MQGVLAPVLTPFDSQLNPDPGRFVSFCRKLLDEGCTGLVPFGTTGEANSLSVEERERLLDALLEGGVPAERLLPGTGCAALPDTVRLSRKAARACWCCRRSITRTLARKGCTGASPRRSTGRAKGGFASTCTTSRKCRRSASRC